MAGVNDPYELYQHVHPSEVGTSLGSRYGWHGRTICHVP